MPLHLRIENESSLPDGGPISCTVTSRRGIDIGRDQYLDWVLPDPSRFISGRHCEIRYRDGHYWLQDVSTNGTFVNRGEFRINGPHALRSGDKIEIGKYIIDVIVEPENGEAPLAEPAYAPQSGDGLWSVGQDAAPAINPRDLRPPPVAAGLNSFDPLDWASDIPLDTPTPLNAPLSPPPASAMPGLGPAGPIGAGASAAPLPGFAAPAASPASSFSGDDWLSAAPAPQMPRPARPSAAVSAPAEPYPQPAQPAIASLDWDVAPIAPPNAAPPIPAPVAAPPIALPIAAPVAAPPVSYAAPPVESAFEPLDLAGANPALLAALAPARQNLETQTRPAANTGSDAAPLDSIPAPSALAPQPVMPLAAIPADLAPQIATIQVTPAQPAPSVAAPPAAPVIHAAPILPAAPPASHDPFPTMTPPPRASSPGEFKRRFAQGAGLPPETVLAGDEGEFAELTGRMLRIVADNLRQLHLARAQAKGAMRSANQTLVGATDNNPLRFLPTSEDALRVMLGPKTKSYLDGCSTLESSFLDLKKHQLQTFSAMQTALAQLLEDIDPAKIEAAGEKDKGGLLTNRKVRLWDRFVTTWQAKVGKNEQGMLGIFMQLFAQAYDRNG